MKDRKFEYINQAYGKNFKAGAKVKALGKNGILCYGDHHCWVKVKVKIKDKIRERILPFHPNDVEVVEIKGGLMQNQNIEELRKKRDAARREYDKFAVAVDKAEFAQLMPGLIRKYVGKYWRVKNSGGDDEQSWMYYYIKGIVGHNILNPDFSVMTFEFSNYSREQALEFKFDGKSYQSWIDQGHEISRRQFTAAYAKAVGVFKKHFGPVTRVEKHKKSPVMGNRYTLRGQMHTDC